MKIKNIDGLTAYDLQAEVQKGGKFVYYPYTISFIIITLKKTSGVYLVRAEEKAANKGLGFTLLSLFFGWWGIPYGPKFTLAALKENFKGGKDITEEIMQTVEGHILFQEVHGKSKSR